MQGPIILILYCNIYASLICQVLSTSVYLLNTQEYLLGDRCCMQGQDWHLFWQRPFFHQLVSTQNQSKVTLHPQVQVSIHPTWRERQLQLPHKHPLHQARLRLRPGEVADSDPEWGLGMLPAADEGTVLWVGGGVWWFSQHPAGSFKYFSPNHHYMFLYIGAQRWNPPQSHWMAGHPQRGKIWKLDFK